MLAAKQSCPSFLGSEVVLNHDTVFSSEVDVSSILATVVLSQPFAGFQLVNFTLFF